MRALIVFLTFIIVFFYFGASMWEKLRPNGIFTFIIFLILWVSMGSAVAGAAVWIVSALLGGFKDKDKY